MLKGGELLTRLIDLDGFPREEAIAQCGYTCDVLTSVDTLPEDEFTKAVFEIAIEYVDSISKARKGKANDLQPFSSSEDHFVKRLSGQELLFHIASIDESFESGPPWKEKRDMVLKSGYFVIDKMGEVRLAINDFHEAYSEALEKRSIVDCIQQDSNGFYEAYHDALDEHLRGVSVPKDDKEACEDLYRPLLKGKQLIQKLVELDGEDAEIVISECGYIFEFGDGKSYLLVDEFAIALSRYGEGYINAIANLRCSILEESPSAQVPTSLLLKRFTGSELIAQVYALDNEFKPGSPSKNKKKLVIKCGYVTLTDQAAIQVDFNAFDEAYKDAHERICLPTSEITHNANTSPSSISLTALAACIANKAGNDSSSIMAIRVTYEGRGDDGAIDTLDYLFAPQEIDREAGKSRSELQMQIPACINFGAYQLKREQYEELIKDKCFEIISNTHGSCFNEEGSSGYLLIDIESSTIHGTHTQYAFQDGTYVEPEEETQYCIR